MLCCAGITFYPGLLGMPASRGTSSLKNDILTVVPITKPLQTSLLLNSDDCADFQAICDHNLSICQVLQVSPTSHVLLRFIFRSNSKPGHQGPERTAAFSARRFCRKICPSDEDVFVDKMLYTLDWCASECRNTILETSTTIMTAAC